MKLNEFDLDLPYVMNEKFIKKEMDNNGLSLQEAKRLDYQQNWKAKRRLFRLETRCMTSMFERLMNYFKNNNFWKVLVEVEADNTESRILNLSGVASVKVNYCYEEFQSLTNYQKKQKTLGILLEGIEKISKKYHWDLNEFNNVANTIINQDYQNEWYWIHSFENPNRKYKADIFCEHQVNNFRINLIVKDIHNQIVKKQSIEELPDEFAYAEQLGKLIWISNEEVILLNEKQDKTLSIKV